MKSLLLAGGIALLTAGTAKAEIYRYDCKVGGSSKRLVVDDAKNTLTWKGRTFRIAIQEECAKFGWRAERPGEAFDFCTATQGYADFKENGSLVRCDQLR